MNQQKGQPKANHEQTKRTLASLGYNNVPEEKLDVCEWILSDERTDEELDKLKDMLTLFIELQNQRKGGKKQ